jgi:exoribonuclease-2/ribonuclease R
MLDVSSLGQLKDLKKQIHDSTVRITGEVKGTRKRFGFVINKDDKQEYLLPQTEMEKVLPGDTVTCVLEKSQKADEKPIARIESFVSSSFDHFLGKVKEKNKQFYVLPDHAQITRWIFIPPKFRKGLTDGDLVGAKICQHPFQNKGRVQAAITHIIGKESDPYIEHRFSIAKHQIPHKEWQQDELEAIRLTGEQTLDNELANASRIDMRNKTFVTIDGANTQDLDDALHIETLSNGNTALYVAIADASSFVEQDSALDRLAQKQISSVYLPAQKIPMLPDVLSSNLCSLKENEDRLALVCQLEINEHGEILDTQYSNAIINSAGKLSYDDVEQFLQGKPLHYSELIQAQLLQLQTLAQARTHWREQNCADMPDYPDYRLILDDNGKMVGIEHSARKQAQKIVEECMLACNSATSEYLAQHNIGLFVGNEGFKPEQLPGIKRVLAEYLPDFDAETINSLTGYLNFQRMASTCTSLNLVEVLKKKLKRSEWQTEQVPHFGLGFSSYTTFSSPIRKYSDLVVHRLIKRLLKQEVIKPLKQDLVDNINTLNYAVRSAQRDCDMSLKTQFLNQKVGETYSGTISMINHRQIGVYWKEMTFMVK